MSFDEGWHVDPSNPRQERYWDGTEWSGQAREHGAFQADSTPRPIAPQRPADAYVDSSSRAAWFIAASPLWLPVPYALLSLFALAADSAGQGRVVYLVVTGVVLLLAAFQDRAVLRELEVRHPASPWWVALTPLAYLIARHRALREVPGYRSSPLTVHIVSITVALVVAVTLLMVSGLPFLMYGGR